MNQIIKRKCPDGSVGIIFRNEKGQILLLERLIEPLGWAPPAGHLDGCGPDKKAISESSEEVCLRVNKLKLLLGPVEMMNPCRRPKDSSLKYNCHDWWVFEATDWEGRPESGEPNAVGQVKWFDISEIKNLKLDPAWEFLFSMLGI